MNISKLTLISYSHKSKKDSCVILHYILKTNLDGEILKIWIASIKLIIQAHQTKTEKMKENEVDRSVKKWIFYRYPECYLVNTQIYVIIQFY